MLEFGILYMKLFIMVFGPNIWNMGLARWMIKTYAITMICFTCEVCGFEIDKKMKNFSTELWSINILYLLWEMK